MHTVDVNSYKRRRISPGCDDWRKPANGRLPNVFLLEKYMPEWPIWIRVRFEPSECCHAKTRAVNASANKSNFDNTKVSENLAIPIISTILTKSSDADTRQEPPPQAA
jgi:hypothetical protein